MKSGFVLSTFQKTQTPHFRRNIHHDKPKPRVIETMKKISRFVIGEKRLFFSRLRVNSQVIKMIIFFVGPFAVKSQFSRGAINERMRINESLWCFL